MATCDWKKNIEQMLDEEYEVFHHVKAKYQKIYRKCIYYLLNNITVINSFIILIFQICFGLFSYYVKYDPVLRSVAVS